MQCTEEEYTLDGELFSLDYRTIDGDVSLPDNSFKTNHFLPHGKNCVYPSVRKFIIRPNVNYIITSLLRLVPHTQSALVTEAYGWLCFHWCHDPYMWSFSFNNANQCCLNFNRLFIQYELQSIFCIRSLLKFRDSVLSGGLVSYDMNCFLFYK